MLLVRPLLTIKWDQFVLISTERTFEECKPFHTGWKPCCFRLHPILMACRELFLRLAELSPRRQVLQLEDCSSYLVSRHINGKLACLISFVLLRSFHSKVKCIKFPILGKKVLLLEIRPLNCGKLWEGKYVSLDRANSFFSCACCGHARWNQACSLDNFE